MSLLERVISGPSHFSARPLLASICCLDEWLKNSKRMRLAMAAVAMLAMLLGACSEHHWPAYRLSEEPLAKLSIDSGRRKNTEVSILGGA